MFSHGRAMSNGGMVQARGDTPLTLDDIRRNVPAVFATEAHESRSERFVPIPSADIIAMMIAEGFEPFFAQQGRSRVPGKADFTQHIVRMRHPDHVNAEGVAYEVILRNGNDGTSAWRILPGFFRFLCMNGLYVGETLPVVSIRHTGNAETVAQRVIAASFEAIRAAEGAAEMIARMRDITVDAEAAQGFAESVHRLRFPNAWEAPEEGAPLRLNRDAAVIQPGDLLNARRTGDAGSDVWSVYNVAQENAMRGGQRGHTTDANGRWRRGTVRAVRNVADVERLNRGIATRAERLADFLDGVAA